MTFYITVASEHCELLPDGTSSIFQLRFPEQLSFPGNNWALAVLDYHVQVEHVKVQNRSDEVFILCDLIRPEIVGTVEAKLLLASTSLQNQQITVPRFKKITVHQANFLTLQFVDRGLKPVKHRRFLLTLAFTNLL